MKCLFWYIKEGDRARREGGRGAGDGGRFTMTSFCSATPSRGYQTEAKVLIHYRSSRYSFLSISQGFCRRFFGWSSWERTSQASHWLAERQQPHPNTKRPKWVGDACSSHFRPQRMESCVQHQLRWPNPTLEKSVQAHSDHSNLFNAS